MTAFKFIGILFFLIGAAGIKQEGRDSSMPPQTRARGKQQDVDVAKLEVNQVQRGKPAAQEKRRRSSRLQNLSLSGASTQLDPKSGIYLHMTSLLFDF